MTDYSRKSGFLIDWHIFQNLYTLVEHRIELSLLDINDIASS